MAAPTGKLPDRSSNLGRADATFDERSIERTRVMRRIMNKALLALPIALVAGMSFALVGPATSVSATPPPAPSGGTALYDSTTSPLPGNLVSQSFEATQTSEFGNQVTLVGSNRQLNNVVVTLSSWGCQSGSWSTGNCVTAPGATFSVPITFNIFNVGPSSAVGGLITTVTKTFAVPYRPSASPQCVGAEVGEWNNGTVASPSCFNGLANNITFTFPTTVTLPANVIYGIAYNTSDYGTTPQRALNPPCEASSGGCGFDSLNAVLLRRWVSWSRHFPA
jgi:hypothetical protein